MKLRHLFSNYKVTGPAEPAVRLAAELMRRGHEVTLAHPHPRREGQGYVDSLATGQGLDTTTSLALPKHFSPFPLLRDALRLADFIDRRGFEIVHCNLVNDHLTAALAARRCNRRPAIVRTNHDAVPMHLNLRNRFLFPKRADALIELSQAALEGDVRRFDLDAGTTHLVHGAIDVARFDPARDLADGRAKLGLAAADFVVGVAARIQKRRRFDVLLDAAAIAREQLPRLKLVIVGRGTHKQAVAVKPAHRLGLDDVVLFPGYLSGDEYGAALRAFDVKVFLVPGTDGSCRAAREAMALGTPVIAARRGMLPELVSDGETGLVVEDSPANLAGAVVRLARDEELRRRMGAAARRTALERFDPATQAEQVERIYSTVLRASRSAARR